MKSIMTYSYHSVLQPLIEQFIAEKRSLGYRYNDEAYFMTQFDTYWKENCGQSTSVTAENVAEWLKQRPTETVRSHSHRIAVTEQFAHWLVSHEIASDFPSNIEIRYPTPIVHILSDEEISCLFAAVDDFSSRECKRDSSEHKRMRTIYSVLFRLIYCLGLRISEACEIKVEDFDFVRGTLLIRGKGDKDRKLSLPGDILNMCKNYIETMKTIYKFNPYWLFSGNDPKQHVSIHTVERQFNNLWGKTRFAATCEKKPTVHSLRHTFAVKRINLWAEKGLNVNQRLPYLSKHMGHVDVSETFYYYHLVLEAFKSVKKKDTIINSILPEVL